MEFDLDRTTQERVVSIRILRPYLYAIALAIVLASWISYMTISHSWPLFNQYWPMSLTMLFGSFVAGSTPQGGAAVAFPVFTKLLHIPPHDSRNFGLMIQSVGMIMASIFIVARGVPVLPKVIKWATLGGVLGMALGTYVTVIPNPYPRILFTIGATAFGIVLFVSRWILRWTPRADLPGWHWGYRSLFIVVGIIGGIFAAHTGSGADILTFIVLTLMFGIDEKISTPTTVIIMGLNSLVGFFLHAVVSKDIGIVWYYWLTAVPVVAIGAPLGAYICSRVHRDTIIKFILLLITIEMISTLLLIPFTPAMQTVTAAVIGTCAFSFYAMLTYRQRKFKKT
ncbi:MAG: sulfite exporter TauE/SafE family protein [Chloroflexi bacterium]|nr:MAG: sulfite exporter TauE/SafE family protein [Chloroflexota bacterium]